MQYLNLFFSVFIGIQVVPLLIVFYCFSLFVDISPQREVKGIPGVFGN